VSDKNELSAQRTNTVINATSKRQETSLMRAINMVIDSLKESYPTVSFVHETQVHLSTVADRINKSFPDVDIEYHLCEKGRI